jgi:hypothetical protein
MPRYLTLKRFCEVGCMSERAGAEIFRSGRAKAFKAGKKWLIEEADAKAYFDRFRSDQAADATPAPAAVPA